MCGLIHKGAVYCIDRVETLGRRSDPVRERRALHLHGHQFFRLVDRIGAVVGQASVRLIAGGLIRGDRIKGDLAKPEGASPFPRGHRAAWLCRTPHRVAAVGFSQGGWVNLIVAEASSFELFVRRRLIQIKFDYRC